MPPLCIPDDGGKPKPVTEEVRESERDNAGDGGREGGREEAPPTPNSDVAEVERRRSLSNGDMVKTRDADENAVAAAAA